MYFDCDGAFDDLIGYMLLRSAPRVDVIGVGILNGDCWSIASYEALRRIESRLKLKEMPCGICNDETPHSFPKKWRDDSLKFNNLAALRDAQPSGVPPSDATQLMIESLQRASEPVTLLLTGPATVIASVLEKRPESKVKIKQLIMMGGAVREKGNVDVDGTDGSAEWNIYCDPCAFEAVLAAGIPIRMIGLDVTSKLPVDKALLASMEKLGKTSAAARICYELCTMPGLPPIYLWDQAAVLAMLKPELFDFEKTEIVVETKGPSIGRTREVSAGKGRSIEFASGCDADGVLRYFFQILAAP